MYFLCQNTKINTEMWPWKAKKYLLSSSLLSLDKFCQFFCLFLHAFHIWLCNVADKNFCFQPWRLEWGNASQNFGNLLKNKVNHFNLMIFPPKKMLEWLEIFNYSCRLDMFTKTWYKKKLCIWCQVYWLVWKIRLTLIFINCEKSL